MYDTKSRTFLVKNHIKSLLGATSLRRQTIAGRSWQWLEAGQPDAKETLVLLHGLGMSKNHWRAVMPPLSEHYRLIVPDVPGLKLSQTPRYPESGLTGLGTELADFINLISAEPVHVIGHSMGAALALSMACRRQLQVRSLVMVSLADVAFTEHLAKELHEERLVDFIQSMTPERHLAYVQAMFYRPPSSIRVIARGHWHDIIKHRSDLVRWLQSMDDEMDELRPMLPTLNRPVLTIGGVYDPWLAIQDRFGEQVMASWQRVSIPKCRHLPFMEQPIDFSVALSQFLSGAEQRGSSTLAG